jgi:hypothetical protein
MLVNPPRRLARPASRSFAVDQPTLLQFVLLSMLLHVLLIVLFGNPVGGTRGGEKWWGPLDVTLRRLSPEPGSGFRLAPGAETSTPSVSLHRLERVPERVIAPDITQDAAPAQPAPAQAVPRLYRPAPEEVDKPLTPPTVAPAEIERIAPARIERELAPPLELPPRAVPMAPAAPIERLAPRQIERELAPPVELPPRAVPTAPAAPIERVAPPQIERELAPPVELPPHAVPAAPAAPIERVAPARIEREFAPPVEAPAPRREPAAAAPQLPRAAPAPAAEPRSPPSEIISPVERAAPVAPPLPQPQRAAPVPPSRLGTSDADEEIFQPRRDVGAPPSEAPRIDLDAARKKAAREIVREGSGSRGVFTIPSPPPEKKSKEAMAMEKAIKPDCRTAYANMGLLAVPVLVASAIAADGSCRW